MFDSLFGYARQVDVLSLQIGAADTNLYRGGANLLKTDDSFYAGGDVIANLGLSHQITLGLFSAQPNIYLGNLSDTHVYRVQAGVVGTTGQFRSTGASGSIGAFTSRISGDTGNRVTIQADGGISWSDGSAAADTVLYRGNANQLKTDDSLVVVGDITATNIVATGTISSTVLPSRVARLTPSGTSTATFASIPGGYRHLEIRGVVRSTASANSDGLRMQINGLSTAIYDWQQIVSINTTSTVTNSNGDTTGMIVTNNVPAANWNANVFGSVLVDLHEYTAAMWKPVIVNATGGDSGGAVQKARVSGSGVIESTATITSITLLLTTGNFAAGTSFDLWLLP